MQDNYCAAVDAGLFVYSNGNVGLCCSGARPLGDINTESVQDIFTKKRFIEIRNNIRNNISDGYCEGCDNADRIAPKTSQRWAFNDSFGRLEKRELRLIDIRWSNVCNLSCRYCNVADSTSWMKLHNIPIKNVNRPYVQSILDEVAANKDTISCVYLLGGEPLLQKYNEQLLDIVRKDVKIDVLTNLSVKLDNNIVYRKLKSMDKVLWNLSFDNVGRRFEYVRHGADWELLKQNIATLHRDFGRRRVTFHPVYTIWNALNLKEFYDFADQNSARVNWQIALPKRDYLASDTFIVFGHKQKIIERAIREIDDLNRYDPSLEGIKQSLINDIEKPGRDSEFLKWTTEMEAFMPPVDSFQNLWPELFDLLNE